MTDKGNQVLQYIDDISTTVCESYDSMCGTLINYYDKIVSSDVYAESYENFYQEANILDEATGKGKFENVVVRIVKFLPRLLIAVGKAIKNVITGNKDDQKEYILGEERIKNASDEELRKLAKTTNELSDGRIVFDPATKKYKLFGVKGLFNKVMMATEVAVIMKRVKQQLDSGTPEYDKIKDELGKIIRKEKQFDHDTASASLSALGKLAQDVTVPADLTANLLFEISGILNNKIIKDVESGKDPSKLIEIRDSMNELKHVARTTAATSFFIGAAKKAKDMTHRFFRQYSDPIKDMKELEKKEKEAGDS